MKNIIILFLIFLLIIPSVGYAVEQTPQAITEISHEVKNPSPTEAPQDGGFKLQWYHYAVAAAIIFGMCIYTMGTVKPATK